MTSSLSRLRQSPRSATEALVPPGKTHLALVHWHTAASRKVPLTGRVGLIDEAGKPVIALTFVDWTHAPSFETKRNVPVLADPRQQPDET